MAGFEEKNQGHPMGTRPGAQKCHLTGRGTCDRRTLSLDKGSRVGTDTAGRRETDSARTWLGRRGEELIPSRLGLT